MADVNTPRWIACAAWALTALPAALFAAEPDKKAADRSAAPLASMDKFLKITRDRSDKALTMDTAIVRYAPADKSKKGPVVDLVGVVHIGERAYYEQLNKDFKDYDAVLYELVAPEGARVPKPGEKRGSHPISFIQRGLKDMLGLEFQLDHIDYAAKNMVHADMSPDEMSKAMEKRGESMWTMLLRMMGAALAQQGGGGTEEADLIIALFSRDRAAALKRAMADQMAKMDGMIAAMEGEEGSTLLAGRNQAAMDVLKKQVAAGKQRLAIFYGAAHLPVFDRQLREQFGLVPGETRWLTAWDMRVKK